MRKHKGRIRINRGTLKAFEDLPENKKNVFLSIKKHVIAELNEIVNIYIHGSFRHGNWDEESDFDVIIDVKCDIISLTNLVREKCGVKVDIFYFNDTNDFILIP